METSTAEYKAELFRGVFTSEECSLMSVMTVAYFTDGRVCTLQLTTRHGYETVAQNGLWVYCVSIGAMLVDG